MKARIEADYNRKENPSLKTVEYCFKHLEDAFKFHRVIDITTPVVQDYTKKRSWRELHGHRLRARPGSLPVQRGMEKRRR
jgi:hypothetical protein